MRTVAVAAAVDDEEEEEFYESLDRILSSSCSSTSASDDDADHRRPRRSSPNLLPSSPPPVTSSDDVWISELSSVEERRRLLLQRLGLAGDPSFARSNHPTDPLPSGVNDGRPNPSSPAAVAVLVRRRSDAYVDPGCARTEQSQRRAISFGSATAANSPPLAVGRYWALAGGKHKKFGDGGDHRQWTIKNLEDGNEFVVKEVQENGMGSKLKEVGTGRQPTMEEFEVWVGRSPPIVQEFFRQQSIDECWNGGSKRHSGSSGGSDGGSVTSTGNSASTRSKKTTNWLRSIRNMAGTMVAGGCQHHCERQSGEKDTSSEKGRRKSSSATDDSLDGSHSHHRVSERIKVRQHGKSYKELSGLYINQELQAHNGAIWSLKFSLDGRYLASGGEDWVIHVWEVDKVDRKEELAEVGTGKYGTCCRFPSVISNGLQEPAVIINSGKRTYWRMWRRAKVLQSRKSLSLEHLIAPDHIFALSENPVCSFKGHTAGVLDLSWSKSQYLLSSSMDKTVRLWHMSSTSCLKTFSHSDYVTCIQFNPVDERYFISGSLDKKVRIWSIQDRQIVDWRDLHEMVTAACFTPNGQAALLGTHKGCCHVFDTSENKLHINSQIYLQENKKRFSHKKITGFQFVPGSSSEVLITSSDSRIRAVNRGDVVHKFKGFRSTSSQISASMAENGKYVICASEDSRVYMWRYDADSQPRRTRGAVNSTQSYEHFHCQDVTVAVSWPSSIPAGLLMGHSNQKNGLDLPSTGEPDVYVQVNQHASSLLPLEGSSESPIQRTAITNSNSFGDLDSAAWPNAKSSSNKFSPRRSELGNSALQLQSGSTWGMAILAAGRGGEIRVYQNFGCPNRV